MELRRGTDVAGERALRVAQRHRHLSALEELRLLLFLLLVLVRLIIRSLLRIFAVTFLARPTPVLLLLLLRLFLLLSSPLLRLRLCSLFSLAAKRLPNSREINARHSARHVLYNKTVTTTLSSRSSD